MNLLEDRMTPALNALSSGLLTRHIFSNALAIIALSLCFTQTSHAGADLTTNTGSCTPIGGAGSMQCSGNMYGIRTQTADANRYASFSRSDTGVLAFKIRIGDVTYSCSAPPSFSEVWQAAMTANASFSIRYDANGVCYALTVANGSAYKGVSSL